MQAGSFLDLVKLYRTKRVKDGKGGHVARNDLVGDFMAHVSTNVRSTNRSREGGQDVGSVQHTIATHEELDLLIGDRVVFRGVEAEITLVHPDPLRVSDPRTFVVEERQRGA